MKKVAIYILASFSFLVGMTSCDKGFDEMNRNPVQATSLDPAFLLNRAIISTPGGGDNLVYEIGIVQQIVSPNGGQTLIRKTGMPPGPIGGDSTGRY
jgi:hypothetical protein